LEITARIWSEGVDVRIGIIKMRPLIVEGSGERVLMRRAILVAGSIVDGEGGRFRWRWNVRV
jgi:hypothetical protein